MKASRICLKYRETAEKTRNARITSSHITKITTSTLHPEKGGKEKNTIKSQVIFQIDKY
jgi:hypothetical protein